MLLQREALIVFEALGIDTAGFHNTWLLTCYRIGATIWATKSLKRESCSVASNSVTLWIVWGVHGLPGSSVPGDSQGKNTGVGCHALLQGIFPTQGWNPGLPHCRWILSQLSHKGSPRILEWVAYPFSSGYSQTRNQTRVSCIAGGFFPS